MWRARQGTKSNPHEKTIWIQAREVPGDQATHITWLNLYSHLVDSPPARWRMGYGCRCRCGMFIQGCWRCWLCLYSQQDSSMFHGDLRLRHTQGWRDVRYGGLEVTLLLFVKAVMEEGDCPFFPVCVHSCLVTWSRSRRNMWNSDIYVYRFAIFPNSQNEFCSNLQCADTLKKQVLKGWRVYLGLLWSSGCLMNCYTAAETQELGEKRNSSKNQSPLVQLLQALDTLQWQH